MKALKLTGLVVAGVVLGAVAASWWWGQVFASQTASKSIDEAFRASEEAEWAAQLRLGEASNVLARLEASMVIKLQTLEQWDEGGMLGDEEREARDRWLIPVKVYHQSYPAGGAGAEVANSLLETIPGRGQHSVCQSGICRLDDMRRERSSDANAP